MSTVERRSGAPSLGVQWAGWTRAETGSELPMTARVPDTRISDTRVRCTPLGIERSAPADLLQPEAVAPR